MTRLVTLLSITLLFSCAKDIVIDPIQYVEYSDEEYADLKKVLDLPRTFDQYDIGPNAFKTATKATLGRVLFYDKSLSEDNSISCGSCHKQEFAFSDNVALSKGIYGRSTDRNSLALGTFASFSTEYGSDGIPGAAALFWDLRADNTRLQIESTMANEKEMGMRMDEVVERMKGKRHYEILFDKAFGTTEIQEEMVLSAIEAFMLGMSAGNSRFDRSQNGSGPSLSDVENEGHKIFFSNCVSCHGRALQLPSPSERMLVANNGLDAITIDRGLGEVSGLEENDGLFKVPSLRNIDLTGPYMHDGRFGTLEEVIDFYSDEIQPHKNLSKNLQDENGNPVRFNFSDQDKKALIAFLQTLTDKSELMDRKFSDPWIK
ncbi:MAG: c-type cytochrome [Saprospiraceae bacterium]|nr:c-type cytochrome [Saprospiraceae bacterium]